MFLKYINVFTDKDKIVQILVDKNKLKRTWKALIIKNRKIELFCSSKYTVWENIQATETIIQNTLKYNTQI